MLDIKFIRENQDKVEKAIKDKGVNLNLGELLNLDQKRREIQKELDDFRAQMNQKTKQKPDEKTKDELRGLKKKIKSHESALDDMEPKFNELLLLAPNIPSEDTPVGPDESCNKEVEKWGSPPKFFFEPKNHIELGKSLNLLDLERGAKVSGFRGYFLKNELAILHWALMWYVLEKMRKNGFEVMAPPAIVKEFALIGSGHFPGERQEIYQVDDCSDKEKEIKFLAGTSEPSLLAYRANEILKEDELPLKYCGLSSCYRREVGGYGKDTKGLFRVHEFVKVEQVVICRNNLEESFEYFEEINKNALEILRGLKLPYRIIQMCTGDMGAGKYKMYDIETWMPSRKAYGETHSNSHLTDWQARRLNMRYRNKDGKMVYPYTMNNTAIASPRILIAIMENYQKKDGSIEVPKVLRKYCGFKKISMPRY